MSHVEQTAGTVEISHQWENVHENDLKLTIRFDFCNPDSYDDRDLSHDFVLGDGAAFGIAECFTTQGKVARIELSVFTNLESIERIELELALVDELAAQWNDHASEFQGIPVGIPHEFDVFQDKLNTTFAQALNTKRACPR